MSQERQFTIGLGALLWMRGNPIISQQHFPDGIFDAADCARVLEELGHDTKLLYDMGLHVLTTEGTSYTCTSRSSSTRVFRYENGLRVHLTGIPSSDLPPAPWGSWRLIDGTIPSSATDELHRYAQGPRGSDRSSAVDCVMVAALCINAGRRRADQMEGAWQRTVGFPSLALGRVIQKPWSKLTPDEIDGLRDIILEVVAQNVEDDVLPSQSIAPVAELLLRGFPQVLMTLGQTIRCTDAVWGMGWVMDGDRVGTYVSVGLDMGMVNWEDHKPVETKRGRKPLHGGEIISSCFGPMAIMTDDVTNACCKATTCTGKIQQHLVIDRVAPVLMLHDWNYAICPLPTGKDISVVSYDVLKVRTTTIYRVAGIIGRGKNGSTLNWCREGSIYRYNPGSNDGRLVKVRRVDDWKRARETIVFLEKVQMS